MNAVNLWAQPDHAQAYLELRRSIPQRQVGMEALMEWVPPATRRVLDLGTGDGVVLAEVLERCPGATGVGLDFSPLMLDAARSRFEGQPVEIVAHDLAEPLPALGTFDLAVSAFAIHHLDHERKQALYGEVFSVLTPGGTFLNLEHVASPTEALHVGFLAALSIDPADDDPSNQLLDVETQLRWLRELGFGEVDCHWKWRELALLAGSRAGDVALTSTRTT